MASVLRVAAAALAPNPKKCYAGCEKLDYLDLIIAKCRHVFCRACLEQWLENRQTCPMDQKALSLITNDNVRQREEDAKISDGGMQYTSFKLYLERFTYYIQNDSPALQGKLAAAKATKITTCELLKAEKAKAKPNPKVSEEDQCASCLDPIPQMYFIIHDEDRTRIGRFMHEDCWQEIVDNKSVLLEISARDMVKVAEQLPPPPGVSPEPVTPISPVKVFFVAIILPASIWALAMNNRIYHNKNVVLYVLSIPALIIFKVLTLLLNGIKAILTDKHA
jgi:hypothetical protein